MRVHYTEKFLRALESAPPKVVKAFNKQVKLFVANLRHPSLRAKKYDESKDLWQARVTGDWRFFFTIEGDVYHLTYIGPHPK